jgi:hypothetical protein
VGNAVELINGIIHEGELHIVKIGYKGCAECSLKTLCDRMDDDTCLAMKCLGSPRLSYFELYKGCICINQ